MTTKNFEGARWGNILLKTIQTRKKMEPGGQGIEPYWGGDFHHQEWVLVCDCGHEFVIESRKFPGRSHLRSCGREECSTKQKEATEWLPVPPARGPGRPLLGGERKTMVHINLPISVFERVAELAAENSASQSATFTRLITAGLAINTQPKKPAKPWQMETV